MKAVAFRAVPAAAWDAAAEQSGEAWLFHRSAWVEIEARFAAKANCSFAILNDEQEVIGIQPLYRRDIDRGWLELVLDSGQHRHTGLALRDNLAAEVRQAAIKLAMRQIFAEAEHHDVDRILLNVQNLAPATLTSRAAEIPHWVAEYGFELGLHQTAVGDSAVPGLSHVWADQLVSLNAPEAELFHTLEPACQRAVRKAERAGLTLQEARDNPVTEYYDLATISSRRTGETLPPRDYYQMIWDRLHGEAHVAVLFVRQGDQAAAGLILTIDKGAAHFLAGVCHHDFLALRVNDYLHWRALCWAREKGLHTYRLGPVFPELPGAWPVAQVSRFKGKFGGKSFLTIQGSYFRKPEKYLTDCMHAAERVCRMRLEEVQAERQAQAARHADAARDLIMVLRRYGYLGIDSRAKAEDLLGKHGLWWPDCSMSLADSIGRAHLVFHPRGDELGALGVNSRPEPGPALLHEVSGKKWWRKGRPIYRALLPHCSFSGRDIEPLWENNRGRAVLAWWHQHDRKVLLVGLDVADELVRYTQGDPEQTRSAQTRSRFNQGFERANYLFDRHVVPGAASVPWADRLGFTLVRLLARQTGLPLVGPLPGGAQGLVLLTGDDDQAALSCYQEQIELLGDFPITYFLLPFTKHTSQTLAGLPPSVEFGLHVDALEHPQRYETICAEQAAAVRALCGQPVRAVRNHGFLNRGYLGHLRAWEDEGLVLDVNYAGLDGTALTGSLLPFRVRRPDRTWSSHLGLLTAFGDGMLFLNNCTEEGVSQRIDSLARQIEQTDPGILVFNMHPENIASTRRVHRGIMALGRRPGWRALGVESFLHWFESWQSLTVRADGREMLVHAPRAIDDLVLRHWQGSQWRAIELTSCSGMRSLSALARAG